ncbi:MAG TPA: amidohydrolase family protein [Acidimicrobiales bacterium]
MTTTVVDSHMHLIDVTNHDWYPGLRVWADQLSVPDLYRDFGVDEYRAAAAEAGLDVVKLVHVSATTKPRAYLDEAAWLDEVADRHGVDLVAIGTVDPTLDEAQMRADLEQQARSPRFRGVRVLDGMAPDSAAARTVLDWLAERDLIFDLVTNPGELPGWTATLARYPDLPVVLEHTGWPTGTDEDSRRVWEAALAAFASSTGERALCKLSGLGMVTRDLGEAALRPWLERALELFGWDRVVFGSNMPIETMGGSYADLARTLDAVVGSGTPEQQAAFYRGNAERVYRF